MRFFEGLVVSDLNDLGYEADLLSHCDHVLFRPRVIDAFRPAFLAEVHKIIVSYSVVLPGYLIHPLLREQLGIVLSKPVHFLETVHKKEPPVQMDLVWMLV